MLFDTTSTVSGHSPPAKTILIVDDDPIVRMLLQATIQGGPYQIVTAADGEEALAAARRYHPALMLLDVSMPKVDGFEVCRQIKSDPATRDIAVIMITAKAQPDDRARGLAAGVDDYITKPFSPLQLLEILEKRLG